MYDPTNPPFSHFTIGELLSIVALILAFMQLSSPMTRFRARAWKINIYTLVSIVFVSVLFVIFAAILPFIPETSIWIFGYPIFWEITSGLLLLFIAARLLWKLNQPAVFCKKNAIAYGNACAHAIAAGTIESLAMLAEEIQVSIEPIFEKYAKYTPVKIQTSQQTKIQFQPIDSKMTEIANTLLDLWSDELFCKVIVTQVPGTAIMIIEQIIKNGRDRFGYALCQQLINQAFQNKNSILMRETKYSGLGFIKQYMNTVFGNWNFIESYYNPLRSWHFYDQEVSLWQVEKYCECVEVALTTYTRTNGAYGRSYPIQIAFENLARITSGQASTLEHINTENVYRSVPYEIICCIGSGISKLLDIIIEQDIEPPQDTFDQNNYDHTKDYSVYAVIAKGIYEYYAGVARCHKHDRALRICAIESWTKIFLTMVGDTASQQNKKNRIAKRLIFHLNEQIDENLDSNRKYYPAITRLLISINTIFEPTIVENNDLGTQFHYAFIQKLKNLYPQIHVKDIGFASDLLPEDVTYNEELGQLHQALMRQRKLVLQLNLLG